MQEGDLVVMPRKLTSQLALGRVAGPTATRMLAASVGTRGR